MTSFLSRLPRWPRWNQGTRSALACAAAALLLLPALASAQDSSPWGLRNIRLLTDWSEPEFEAKFADHGAGHVAFWLWWSELEPVGPECTAPPCPTFCTDVLDKALGFVAALDATPVLVFHPGLSAFAPGGEPCCGNPCCTHPSCGFWAMNGSPESFGPADLTVPLPVTTCPDPDVVYSQELYDVSFALAERVADTGIEGPVYMRFFNEAWGDWPLSTNPDLSLYRYILSYLTFRKGILDAQAASSNLNVDFRVGHGSVPRGRIAQRSLWEQGVGASEAARHSLAQRLDSLIERTRCNTGKQHPGLVAAPGLPAYVHTWAQATLLAGPGDPSNQLSDAWLDAHVAWTALCRDATGRPIFDFTTAHPHGKPEEFRLARSYFDAQVQAAMTAAAIPGGPPEWIAAEVAFQLSDQASWGVFPLPGAGLDRFIAEDLGRKWCVLLANARAFCSPILAGFPNYRGLFRKQGSLQPVTGCNASGTPQGTGTGCTMGSDPQICPDPADQAFRFLSAVIGSPTVVQTIGNPAGVKSHYRYRNASGVVDVLWRNPANDGDTTTKSFALAPPDGYHCGLVHDVLGNQTGTLVLSPGGMVLQGVDQAPRVIVWACKLQEL